MKQKRQGFTAVELLIVILIIVLLMGLVVIGIGMYQSRAKQRETKLLLQSLTSIMRERANDFQRFPPQPPPWPASLNANPGSVVTNAAGRTGDWVIRTRTVLARLRAVPASKTAIDNLPTERKFTFGGSTDPVILDAWDNPIIYVPADGLAGVIVRNQTTIVKAPGDRAFWASAGPDGDFSTGSDNIYSFEN